MSGFCAWRALSIRPRLVNGDEKKSFSRWIEITIRRQYLDNILFAHLYVCDVHLVIRRQIQCFLFATIIRSVTRVTHGRRQYFWDEELTTLHRMAYGRTKNWRHMPSWHVVALLSIRYGTPRLIHTLYTISNTNRHEVQVCNIIYQKSISYISRAVVPFGHNGRFVG